MAATLTGCTYDCPDACSLLVHTDGGGLRIAGDPEHPITRGFACYRIHRQTQRLRSPERITRPLLRKGSGFTPMGWDEALDLAAGKLGSALDRHGAPSVAFIGGGGSLGLSKELVGHFFRSLGPVTTVRGGVCGEAGEAAQRLDFGEPACHDYTDLAHSAAVVLWGKNPVATGLHLVPFIREARRRGAPVVLVDPMPSESTRLADLVIRVTPGGDGYLALAVLRLLHDRGQMDPRSIERVENFDAFARMLATPELAVEACARRADVSITEVEALATLYTRQRPVATWVGWGLQRCGPGGANIRCIDALGLLTGNVGLPGGGVNFTSWRRRGLDLSMLAPATGRTVAAPTLGRDLAALDDPVCRLAYIAAANPVNQLADSRAVADALERVDFVVVADAFLTDTARTADLVLPVQLMLEEDDVVGSFQHHHVAVVKRVVNPPDGARGDLWIVRELGRRLGLLEDPLLADPAAALRRMTAPWFAGGPVGVARNPTQAPVPFAGSFSRRSGRALLVTEPPCLTVPDEDYPLTFMTVSSRRWQTSQLFEHEQQGSAQCAVHPEAPGAASLREGDRALVISPLGRMEVIVRLDRSLHPRTCLVHRGGWICHGRGVNTLVSARATDLGEGTAFLDQRVRLSPLPPDGPTG